MELTRMTAAELSAALASGEVSATEVTQAHLDRIAAVDDRVHAFLHIAADRALAQAAEVDNQRRAGADLGPLAGGIYHYQGEAGELEFVCTYKCKYDHGIFRMKPAPQFP